MGFGLAAHPSRSARMHGMPPPTAASHPIFAWLLSATEVSSAACTASIAWFAVTTGLGSGLGLGLG